MKEFEKWHEQFKHKSFNAYWHRKAGWVSALIWMKDKLNCEICPSDIEYFIDKELNEED